MNLESHLVLGLDVLWLSEDDVRSLLNMDQAIEAVEAAFRDQGLGLSQMPPKSYLNFPEGDLRTMPAYLQSMGASGVKIVNVHPKKSRHWAANCHGIAHPELP
jgi:alanine dehydrogenase